METNAGWLMRFPSCIQLIIMKTILDRVVVRDGSIPDEKLTNTHRYHPSQLRRSWSKSKVNQKRTHVWSPPKLSWHHMCICAEIRIPSPYKTVTRTRDCWNLSVLSVTKILSGTTIALITSLSTHPNMNRMSPKARQSGTIALKFR